ncbi:hypothetical protein HaLaN_19238, partial [Haematococcus lacustris]
MGMMRRATARRTAHRVMAKKKPKASRSPQGKQRQERRDGWTTRRRHQGPRGWSADAVLRACRKVVCRPRGAGQRRGRVVLVNEHRTTRVSSARAALAAARLCNQAVGTARCLWLTAVITNPTHAMELIRAPRQASWAASLLMRQVLATTPTVMATLTCHPSLTSPMPTDDLLAQGEGRCSPQQITHKAINPASKLQHMAVRLGRTIPHNTTRIAMASKAAMQMARQAVATQHPRATELGHPQAMVLGQHPVMLHPLMVAAVMAPRQAMGPLRAMVPRPVMPTLLPGPEPSSRSQPLLASLNSKWDRRARHAGRGHLSPAIPSHAYPAVSTSTFGC